MIENTEQNKIKIENERMKTRKKMLFWGGRGGGEGDLVQSLIASGGSTGLHVS